MVVHTLAMWNILGLTAIIGLPFLEKKFFRSQICIIDYNLNIPWKILDLNVSNAQNKDQC